MWGEYVKVSDGNGTNLRATLGPREWVKLIGTVSGTVLTTVGVLSFIGASPGDVRSSEARVTRIEQNLEATSASVAAVAKKLDEHLEQTRTGYERISALEQHARDLDRRLDRLGE